MRSLEFLHMRGIPLFCKVMRSMAWERATCKSDNKKGNSCDVFISRGLSLRCFPTRRQLLLDLIRGPKRCNLLFILCPIAFGMITKFIGPSVYFGRSNFVVIVVIFVVVVTVVVFVVVAVVVVVFVVVVLFNVDVVV